MIPAASGSPKQFRFLFDITLFCCTEIVTTLVSKWNFCNSTPFICPLIFHTCDCPPSPSLCLPIQNHVEGSHAEMVTKDHRASPPPLLHLHVLSQLLNTLKLITVSVTSIQIQLSSGLEIN